jgi:SPX domain protein involved in polyphosphate accumulation
MIQSDYRFERKFIASDEPAHVEQSIKMNPYGFMKVYPARYVNSLYLDSVDLQMYRAHVAGHPYRKKFRIRWYGDLRAESLKLIFECKMKGGYTVRKMSCPLPDAAFSSLDSEGVASLTERSTLSPQVRHEMAWLRPVVVTRYKREYYASRNNRVRMTIDSDLHFYSLGSYGVLNERRVPENKVILELKYPTDFDDPIDVITRRIPYRMTRFSKYVTGVCRISGYAL